MSFTSPIAGQKILVTGARGFLGSHLCTRLTECGAEVHALSRTPEPEKMPRVCWWRVDLTDMTRVQELLRAIKPDSIYHLAGQTTAERERELVLPVLQNTLLTTVHVLLVAGEIGCRRIVLAASLEEPPSGNGEVAPSSPYAAAKWASSVYARMFHDLYGAPIVITRPFMTYGPGQRTTKIIPYLILSLLQAQPPKLTSGQRLVDWVYVNDVIEGLVAAGQVPGIEGCTIDLGSGFLVSIHDVVQQLVKLVGARVEPLFGALSERTLEQVRAADTAGAYQKLGWKAKTPLEKGLQLTVDWYRRTLVGSKSN